MSKLKATIDQREAVLGKALCWLRLVRGIPTLLEADGMYREQVRPSAASMEFGSRVSRYERGLGQPRPRMLMEMLALYGVDFHDFETSLAVMMKASSGLPTLRRSLAKGSSFHGDVARVVKGKARGVAAVKDLAISSAELALNR